MSLPLTKERRNLMKVNLLYFLPPFNTAIVKGLNAITASKVKLGRWLQHPAMRSGMLRFNDMYLDVLSNDLQSQAFCSMLVPVGSQYHLSRRQ